MEGMQSTFRTYHIQYGPFLARRFSLSQRHDVDGKGKKGELERGASNAKKTEQGKRSSLEFPSSSNTLNGPIFSMFLNTRID